MNKENLFKIIDKIHENGNYTFNIGKLDGDDFLIVQSWDDYYHLFGIMNGVTAGLPNEPSGWKDGKKLSFAEIRDEAEADLKEAKKNNPNNLGTIYRKETIIEACNQWILFTQQNAIHGIETISIDDIEDLSWGFADEFSMCAGSCNGCNNVVRTSPDSYEWIAPPFLDGEGYFCEDCALNEIDNFKEQSEGKAIVPPFTPKLFNIVPICTDWLENGWHEGMNDDPEAIVTLMHENGIDVWFEIQPSQFYVRFKPYVAPENQEKAIDLLFVADCKERPSPAEKMKAALQAASVEFKNHLASKE